VETLKLRMASGCAKKVAADAQVFVVHFYSRLRNLKENFV
jgi:hypothetical protein